MGILAFAIIIIVLIFVHEMGHFITAKMSGVKVLEFGFGYPPRLVAIRRGETEYSLNMLPLGGFVRLSGEEDPQETGSLAGKSLGTRALVLGAGSVMNALLPVLLLTLSFIVPHQVVVGQVAIESVVPGSPAERAGLLPGDVIVELDGRPISNSAELIQNIQLNLGQEVQILVRRDSRLETVRAVPRWQTPPQEGPLGVMLAPMKDITLASESYPVWQAIPRGLSTLVDTFRLFHNEIAGWFIRHRAPQVAGPIGMAQLTGQVARAGPSPLMVFASFISINLAIVNLMPIPGLDGGRLVFVALEALRRGKRISPRKERLVHLVGFLLLIALMVVVSYYDIMRLATGE